MVGSVDMQNSIAEVDSEDQEKGDTFEPATELQAALAEPNDIDAKLESE